MSPLTPFLAVYKDYDGVSNNELFVKKGDLVGIVEGEADEKVPEGFLKVSIKFRAQPIRMVLLRPESF